MAARTMLFSGCCAVSVEPPVWVCVRSISERGSHAPKRVPMIRDHMRRSARYFAISSKKSMCVLKIQDSLGAKSSTATPRSTDAWTYAHAFAMANAISWGAVLPASRMWYPESDIGLNFGVLRVHQTIRSAARRREGLGG